MSPALRMLLLTGLSLFGSLQAGCNMVPRSQLSQAQNRTRQLYDQNRAMAAERNGLLSQIQTLQQQIAGLNARDETLQARVNNLLAERNQLAGNRNPLSDSTNRQFADLAQKYPGFEFDPQTGVSKFHNDILFESGSDELRRDAAPLLAEFSKILNNGEASELNVLVAGQTDYRKVVKASPMSKLPVNWHLTAIGLPNICTDLAHYDF